RRPAGLAPPRLLRVELGHLPARLLEPRRIPLLADTREDVPLLLLDVLLERGVDLLDRGEPPLVLRIEARGLLHEAFDLGDPFLVAIGDPLRERGVGRAFLLEGPVEARLLDLLMRLELRVELLPQGASLGRRSLEQLGERRLGLLVLLLEELDRVHGQSSLPSRRKQGVCKAIGEAESRARSANAGDGGRRAGRLTRKNSARHP